MFTILDRFGATLYEATDATTKEGAVLEGLAETTPQSFENAALAGADFTDADLTGIDLTNADLFNAILTGAILTDAIMTGTVLTGATMDPMTAEVVTDFPALISSYDISGYDGSLIDGFLKIHLGSDLEYNQMNIIPFVALAEVDSSMVEMTVTELFNNQVMLSGIAGCNVTVNKNVLLANGQMKIWPVDGVTTKHYMMAEITIAGFIG